MGSGKDNRMDILGQLLNVQGEKNNFLSQLMEQKEGSDALDPAKAKGITTATLWAEGNVGPEGAAQLQRMLFEVPQLVNNEYSPTNNAADMQDLTPIKAAELARQWATENGVDPDLAMTYLEIVRRG